MSLEHAERGQRAQGVAQREALADDGWLGDGHRFASDASSGDRRAHAADHHRFGTATSCGNSGRATVRDGARRAEAVA